MAELSLGDTKAVQTLLEQRKEEALWMGWVVKRDEQKREKRLVVVAKNRIFSLRQNSGKTVVARESHWLDVVSLISPNPKDLNMQFKQFKLHITHDAVDEILDKIRNAYHAAFPGVSESERYRLEVNPTSRLKDLPRNEAPLGGFITTYKSLCDYYPATEVREDIVWDMENLFIPGNIKDFNLKEFEQPISFNEFRALLGALQYNSYFKSLTAKGAVFDKGMVQCVADTLRFNTALEELSLTDLGMKADGIAAISDALAVNKFLGLTTINLSHNAMEDKGMIAFANYLSSMNRGLVKLSVSQCSVGKAGMVALCNALKKNVHMSSTLVNLDISRNKLEADGSSGLAAFLANPNQLRVLLMADTAANLEVIMGALVRGSPEMSQLDISQNKVTKKETAILAKYLQASASLTDLNLANTQAPVDSVKDVITAITSNPYLKDCKLNLAENKLGVPGARVLASLADKLVNITWFDLSDNDLGDDGVSILCEGLCYNTHLKSLSLDKNFKGKTKARNTAIESIVNLISSACPLESLSLAGGKGTELKLDILPLLYALGTNESLKTLDISNNQMGNKGAGALGKALQTNDALLCVKWDGNLTTAAGFAAFNNGLKRNHALKIMPMPINDIAAALKGNELQMNDVVQKIQSNISRNQSPAAFALANEGGSSNAAASQFGFLASGTREEVQKLLFKIKSTGRKVPDDRKVLMEDAEKQDQVMTGLFGIQDAINQAYEHELKTQLINFVKQSSPLFQQLKQQMIEQLMTHVRKNYRCLDEDIIRRLQTNLAYGGKELPEEELEKVIVELAGQQLSSKAGQAFHSVATIASDYLYEKLQDQLVDVADELTSEVTQDLGDIKKGGTFKGTPPPTPSKDSKPPAKAQPPTPVKKAEPAKPAPPPKGKPAPPPKSAKPKDAKGSDANNNGPAEPTTKVEDLPKKEGNLEHVTKSRPGVQGGRKPPSRKRRPAPPGQTPM